MFVANWSFLSVFAVAKCESLLSEKEMIGLKLIEADAKVECLETRLAELDVEGAGMATKQALILDLEAKVSWLLKIRKFIMRYLLLFSVCFLKVAVAIKQEIFLHVCGGLNYWFI